MQPWKTVRIFVSSTFRDMHVERDHLVRVVFPELRERCAGRNLHLVDVDLRWGVTEEEAESGQVLEICLDEIERCRPFFIGILGERYGSAAAMDRLSDEPRYDWLRQFALGHSITALEIYHGVVRNLQMKGHAFFYFRDPAFIRDIPEPHRRDFLEEGESEEERRLRQLKAVVRQYWPVFDGYPCRYDGIGEDGKVRLAGLEAFGQRVLEDLWSAIVAGHPESGTLPDELAIERSYHEAFVAGRARGSSGKSALLARFAHEYARDHADTFVLAQFIGAAPGSADLRRTLLRLCRELARHFDLAEEIPEEYEALRGAFPGLLERAAERGRFVLVLDALDQLSAAHHARRLDWLPPRRLVVSTLEGEILDRLRGRSPPLPELEVTPLGRAESREIVRRTLWEYRKRLAERPDEPDQDQLGLLLAKPDAGNPLYLAVEAANQPDGSAPAQVAGSRWRAGLERRPWLRLINKPEETGSCLMTLTGHGWWVQACAFSPDGTRIVSASSDKTLKVWDAATGEILAEVDLGASVDAAAWDPADRILAAGDATGRVHIFSIEGLEPLPSAHVP